MKTQLSKAMHAAGFVALILAWVAPPVEALTCGDTVAPGSGTVVLTADLRCSQAPLRIGGPNTTLDMAGHEVLCLSESGPLTGIELFGSGATLKNGTVVGCTLGVRVGGTGDHRVLNTVAAYSVAAGFLVESNKNTIVDSVAETNLNNGFAIGGDSNELDNDTAYNNIGRGFVIGGDSNTVKGSVAVLNGFEGACLGGFTIFGHKNKFSNDTSSSNCGHGFSIEAGADLNQFKGTIASSNENSGTQILGAPAANGFNVLGSEGVFVGNIAIDNRGGNGFSFEIGSGLNDIENNTASGNFVGIALDRAILNTLIGNKLYANFENGIVVYLGASNVFKGNVSLGNFSFDLVDFNANCGTDTWTGNIFNPAGVASCIH